ncbi:hypothetical protein P5V15_001181 [Pogonomyrmex californicus]
MLRRLYNKTMLLVSRYAQKNKKQVTCTNFLSLFFKIHVCIEKQPSDESKWSDESMTFILDKYSNNLELVELIKKFKNKKAMWQQIAEDLESNLGIKKHMFNRFVYGSRCFSLPEREEFVKSPGPNISFEDEIKKITVINDSVEPEILQSANKVVINAKENASSQICNTKK